MIRSVRQPAILLFLSIVLPVITLSEDTTRSTDEIRKELNAVRQKAQGLEREQQHLADSVERGRNAVKQYDGQIQIYETNLADARKIIDAAQAEIERIQKRNRNREILFTRTLELMSSVAPARHFSRRGDIHCETISQAALDIACDMFKNIQDEIPRLQELQQTVHERQAYQERIRNRYLPADTQKKNQHEEIIDRREKAITDTEKTSQQIREDDRSLSQELEKAEVREREIRRRITQQKEQEREEKKLAQETDRRISPNQPKSNPPDPKTDRAPESADQPFSVRKGRLPWPLRGEIIQPFGEFTHPQYQVKIKNYGITVRASNNDSVCAIATGQILYTGEIPGFGRTVIIDHGDDYVTVYANIKEKTNKGERVKTGQIVGTVIGDNYHFEIRHGETALDPQTWLHNE